MLLTTYQERAELERKSATQRGEEAGRKVQQLLGEQNERKEVTDTFVRQHAGSLRRLLKAGGQVDSALEDELLGLAPRPDSAGMLKPRREGTRGFGGYDGGALPPTPADEEEEEAAAGGAMDMKMAMMMSMMDGGRAPSMGDAAGGITTMASGS